MDAQGYDESRFINPVRRELICGICRDVVNDPRCCQNKEHPFCLACITRYLQNPETQECPVCRHHLTPETLKHPGRFFMICLSELKIKCDYIDRGCPDHIPLGNLQHHVHNCGFAPVKCEKCDMQINRKDKDNHDKSFCQLGGAKCQDCGNIKASQDEMKAQLYQVKGRQGEMMETLEATKTNQELMMITLTEILNDQRGDKLMENVDEIKESQDAINVKLNQMKESVDEMRQQFEKMMIMVHQALQGSNVNNNGAQAIDPAVPANNQDIIILSGRYGPRFESVSNTVEKYNIVEEKSTQLPQINHPREASASCVYNGDIIVAGGYDGQACTDLIEILKMNQHPLRWTMFGVKLPVKLSGHIVTVYQDKSYITGGFNWIGKKTSDAIYELALAPPYTAKRLARMPQARQRHRAEIVNGKLFILGGSTIDKSEDSTDSVVVYDFIKNEVKPCPSLPKPIWGMSTVTWGNIIIVVGGADKNDQDLNDVIMYDTETGRSERLPSLKHKRFGSSAVIMHDVIVVLGGWNEEEGYLNSVESFTMGDDQWKELPGMTEKRYFATAVVKRRK